MKKELHRCFLLAALLALGLSGCASPNVNPPQARSNTGYVDLYAEPASELSWQVARFEEASQAFKSVFSQYAPLPDRVLRLAFPPGHHRLQITFLNRVSRTPAEVEVEVLDGKITPVRITLTQIGDEQVRTKDTSFGGTAYGRYGRRTEIGSENTAVYNISAVAEPSVAYQPKDRVPYAR